MSTVRLTLRRRIHDLFTVTSIGTGTREGLVPLETMTSSSRAKVVSYLHLVLMIIFAMYVVRTQLFHYTFIFEQQLANNRNVAVETKATLASNVEYYEHRHHPRILIGIFTTDFEDGYEYRSRHRTLFASWNDTRICSLYDYERHEQKRRQQSKNKNNNMMPSKCEYIYTFVIGANPYGPPILLSTDNDGTPTTATYHSNSYVSSWTVPRPIINTTNDDINTHNDITLLNIRENMNEGKSQSWIAYSVHHLSQLYHFDYVAKWDADSILLLPEYFEFVYKNLPRAPYNRMMYVGGIYDKAYWSYNPYWPGHTVAEHILKELFFDEMYNRVHVYVSGQVYFVANDLAQYITNEAIVQLRNCTYCEGVEDHDISTIAFHSTPNTTPIKFVFLSMQQKVWLHPIKTNDEWNDIWQREKVRIKLYHHHHGKQQQ
jgi:hypothetical protein